MILRAISSVSMWVSSFRHNLFPLLDLWGYAPCYIFRRLRPRECLSGSDNLGGACYVKLRYLPLLGVYVVGRLFCLR
jgi:hypothetical protein